VKSTNEHNLSHETKTGVLQNFTRRTEPDDLEAQIKALKAIQQQPGFMVKKPVHEKKENGFFAAFKKKLVNVMHFFSGKK
jgi:hypothetical protein